MVFSQIHHLASKILDELHPWFHQFHGFLKYIKKRTFEIPHCCSLILRVHGSSGHEPDSTSLQNKQGIDGGVPVGLSDAYVS